MRLSRADRSIVSDWWFSIDRTLLGLVFVLMFAGLIMSLAASPSAAVKMGYEPFHYVIRHALFLGLCIPVFLIVSLLDSRQIRRLGLALFAFGIALMVAALIQGVERNGAVRWISFGGLSLQPSEFAKPGFIIVSAWLLAEGVKRADVPALPLAAALLMLFAALLVMQPDVGQTMLVCAAWGSLFFLGGYSLRWVAALGAVMAAGATTAYFTVDHVQRRFDDFFAASPAANTQSSIAFNAFREGGWLGRGPGEGILKTSLPDAHTDYVFAVAGEEFGITACLFIALLYALMAWRGVVMRAGETNDFENLAKTGLAVLLVFQALINMAVNVNLIPAKGVTLPFISYGGSSMISVAITLGMMLALSRRRTEHTVGSSSRTFDANGAMGELRI